MITNTMLSILINIPANITKLDPNDAIKIPPKKVPTVVPKLTEDRKIPFDKSGASGADDVMTYCVTLADIPANVPHIIEITIIKAKYFPKLNISI